MLNAPKMIVTAYIIMISSISFDYVLRHKNSMMSRTCQLITKFHIYMTQKQKEQLCRH